jgi:hypothetical protein
MDEWTCALFRLIVGLNCVLHLGDAQRLKTMKKCRTGVALDNVRINVTTVEV